MGGKLNADLLGDNFDFTNWFNLLRSKLLTGESEDLILLEIDVKWILKASATSQLFFDTLLHSPMRNSGRCDGLLLPPRDLINFQMHFTLPLLFLMEDLK